MRRPVNRRWIWLAVSSVVLVGGARLGWRAVNRHTLAAQSVPDRPALNAWPAELADRIARGEEAAQGYFRPISGLAALSRLYHANGFYNEAIRCYEGLQRLEPGEARWPHLLASILGGFGRLDEALLLCQRATDLAPGYLPARLRLGDILLKAGRPTLAAKTYAEALERDPGHPYALFGLARCAIAAGDWPKAREHLQQAVKLHPDFVGGLSLLVTVSEHFADQATADSLRAAINQRQFLDLPDPWLDSLSDDCYDPYRLSVAAAVANFSGDAAAARRWLERAIALAPASSSYPRALGKMFLQARDYATARQYLEKAVAVAPGDSDAWALLVEALTAMGDLEAAQRALAAGLVNCPQSPGLHYAYGRRLSGAGRINEAIAEFKTTKSLRPNEANAYVDLALVYFQMERMDEAIAELKAALTVQPGHPLALEVLARHAIGTNDEPAARHWIRQLRLQPRVPAEDLNTIIQEYQQHFGRAPW